MTLKSKLSIEFYQNLGKLFYAIAITDNCVRDEELKTLEKIIKNEWMILTDCSDKDNQNKILLILDTFKQLQNQNKNDANSYFNSFINFKKAHEAFFNKEFNSLILKTANKIAAAFAAKNKSELIMLAKLNLELKKL